MRTKHFFILLVIAMMFLLTPLTSPAEEEGHFETGNIFTEAITEPQQNLHQNEDENGLPLTILLAGLMVSVFIVTGAARSYVNLFNCSANATAAAKTEIDKIIASSAIVHTEQLKERMVKIDNLDLQIEQLEMQLELEECENSEYV